jgi:hypothetical protein
MSRTLPWIRGAAAIVLVLHGLVHALGFVALWQLAELEGIAYRTTVLDGRLEIGDTGTRILGLAWLALVPAFVVAAYGVATGRRWALPVVGLVAAASLVVSILGLPDSRPGLMIDVAILAVAGYLTLIVPSGRARSG